MRCPARVASGCRVCRRSNSSVRCAAEPTAIWCSSHGFHLTLQTLALTSIVAALRSLLELQTLTLLSSLPEMKAEGSPDGQQQ